MVHSKCRFRLSLCIILLLSANGYANDTDRQALGFLKEAYLRNRESFPIVNCRFEWREGKTATREDAFDERFIGKPTLTQLGHWLVNGPLVRYELLCSPELTHETNRRIEEGLKMKEKNISIPCMNKLYLRSDTYSLRYGPVNMVANLFTKTDEDPDGIRVTPFNPDCLGPDEYSSPAFYIQSALDGRFEAKYLGSQKIDGTDMLVIGVASGLRQKFGFDPKRNYLMTYASDKDILSGKRYYEVEVLDAKECSGGRWFPTRIVSILNPDSNASPFEVRVLKVMELDVDTKPPLDFFRLTLPSGVQVNRIGVMEWLNLSESTNLAPADLPKLHERMKQAGENYFRQQEAEQESLVKHAYLRTMLATTFVCMMLVLSVVLYYKWRRSKIQSL